jgi:hypothetical protein
MQKMQGPDRALPDFSNRRLHREDRRDGQGRPPPTHDRDVFVLGTAMTGKDDTMEWKQIETKWAAMTRRIRADYIADRIERPGAATRDLPQSDVLSATIADSVAGSAKHPDFKIPDLKTTAK